MGNLGEFINNSDLENYEPMSSVFLCVGMHPIV